VVAQGAGAQVQGANRNGSAGQDVRVPYGGGEGGAVATGNGTRGANVHDLHPTVRLRLDRKGSPVAMANGVPGSPAGHHHEQVELHAGPVPHVHPALRVPLATALLPYGHRHPLSPEAFPREVLPHLRRAVQGVTTSQSCGALDPLLHLIRSF